MVTQDQAKAAAGTLRRKTSTPEERKEAARIMKLWKVQQLAQLRAEPLSDPL